MKKHIFVSCLTLLLAFLAVVSVQAQATGTYRAEIPFDFTVGNMKFEAGEYVISFKDATDLATILSVRNERSKELLARAVIRNGSTSVNDRTVLTFARFGDQYVLKRIAAPGFGFNAPKSKVAELLAEKSKAIPEVVSVVISRNIQH